MPAETTRFRRNLLASAATASVVAFAALGVGMVEETRPALAQPLPATPIEKAPADQPPGSFAGIVDKVKPAVVSVKVKIEDSAASADGPDVPPQIKEFLKRFGGEAPSVQPKRPGGRSSQGSGFFVTGDGFIVTNNHVVDKGASVQVSLDDGRTLDAKVVGKDPKTDLALLKVEPQAKGEFPYVRLAKDAPRVGDWVVAIGNPFGLGGSVTAGIVSARGRDIGSGPYDDFLQIDAPINRGNSGGPTFNVKGEVVGVNTAIASPSGGSVGLAFAIPSETVQAVVDQLRNGGKVARGYLGVRVQPVTRDIADGLGLDEAAGALVDQAQANSPADKAGIKAGDVVLTLNGDAIHDARELSRKVASVKPGDKVELGYLRGGRKETATVTLEALPDQDKSEPVSRQTRPGGQPRLGLSLSRSEDLGMDEPGVVVVEVDPDGPAAAKGIERGDMVLKVNGDDISSPPQVGDALRKAEESGRKAVLILLKSAKGGTRYVALPIKAAAKAPDAAPEKVPG